MKRLVALLTLSGVATFLLVWLMAFLIKEPVRDSGEYIGSQLKTVNDIQFRKPLYGEKLPEREECTREFIDGHRGRVLKMRSCAVSSDCLHVNNGHLSMLAINKQYKPQLNQIIKNVESVCGHRASHDAFYSDFGIKIECDKSENQCVVRDITYDETLDAMLDEFMKDDK